MIKLQLIGRISTDAQVKDANGKKYIHFSAYHTRKVNDEYKSTFVNCTYFTDKADTLAKWLIKGKAIFIEGEPSARAYIDKENKPQSSLEVLVRNIEFVQGDKVDQPQQQVQTVQPQGVQPAPSNPELPF